MGSEAWKRFAAAVSGNRRISLGRNTSEPDTATMDPTMWQYQFRVILLGDSTVGKTSLVRRYTEDAFLDSINETVGVDFYVRFLDVEPGVRVKLQFWDTAGQERFRSVTRSYFRNSAGSLLVFDITNRESFEHIRSWHAAVVEHVQPHTILFVLVGQKSDLGAGGGQRAVSREEAESLAEELGAPYMEVSAKKGLNVGNTFQLLAQRIYQGLQSGEVQVQDGWDGIKCSGALLLHSRRASKARAQKKKCCG